MFPEALSEEMCWKLQLVSVSHTHVAVFRTVHNRILTFCKSFKECLSSRFFSGNHPFTKLISFDHHLYSLTSLRDSCQCLFWRLNSEIQSQCWTISSTPCFSCYIYIYYPPYSFIWFEMYIWNVFTHRAFISYRRYLSGLIDLSITQFLNGQNFP